MLNKKKICLVGDFAVGKTSLTQRFVNNVFSEKYLSTVGVKIDTTVIDDNKLIIWDIAGRDAMSPININYLIGAAGIILVIDATRIETVQSIIKIQKLVTSKIGEVPVIIAMNKTDLCSKQQIKKLCEKIPTQNNTVIKTSAKNGYNVETIFHTLNKLLD